MSLEPKLPEINVVTFHQEGHAYAYYVLAREAVKALIRIANAFELYIHKRYSA